MKVGMEDFGSYFDEEKLGYFHAEIPVEFEEDQRYGEVIVDLKAVYRSLFSDKVDPESSKCCSVCLIGSTLHRSSDVSEMPNDFDLLVLYRSEERSIFVPGKEVVPRIERRRYGEDRITSSAVYTKEPSDSKGFLDFLGIKCYGHKRNAIPLHIVYRTVEQFKKGVEGTEGVNELVSASCYREGVPIIGEDNFEEIAGTIGSGEVERDPLHGYEWREVDGVLEGELL